MIIFAAQLAAGILSAIYGSQVTDYLADESKDFLMNGFNEAPEADVVNKTITAAWNEVQTVVSFVIKIVWLSSTDPTQINFMI